MNAHTRNPQTSSPAPGLRRRQRGVSLILVCAGVLIVSGVVFAGIDRLRAAEDLQEVRFSVRGQAYAAARAGLTDAIAWLRRQTSQPVAVFAPKLDLTAAVPVFETEDPTIGLVRSFELSPGIWARYEVRRGRPMDPFTDLNQNAVYDEGEPFEDLSNRKDVDTTEDQAAEVLQAGDDLADRLLADGQAGAAAIIATAAQEAADLIAAAEQEAPDLIAAAQQEAADLIAAAEQEAADVMAKAVAKAAKKKKPKQKAKVIAKAEAEVAKILADAAEDAAKLVSDANDDGAKILADSVEDAAKLTDDAAEDAAKLIADSEKAAAKAIEDAEEDAANLLKDDGSIDKEVLAASIALLREEARRPTAISISDGYDDGIWTPARWTRNIDAERAQPGVGGVWQISSRAIVYRLVDPEVAPGTDPNRILGSATLCTEVRRLALVPPAAAAICARQERSVTLGAKTRIRAEELAIAVGDAGGRVSQASGSEIDAPAVSAVIPDYEDSVRDIFGVSWVELQSMADASVAEDNDALLAKIEQCPLVTVEGDAVFGADRPLRGKGILAVRGDLVIKAGSNSFFTGVIYVDGNVTVHAPAFLRGTVISTGNVAFNGTGIDYVEMEHEPGIVKDLLKIVGQYRVTRAIYDKQFLHGRARNKTDRMLTDLGGGDLIDDGPGSKDGGSGSKDGGSGSKD